MVSMSSLPVLVLAVPEKQQELNEPGSPGILSCVSQPVCWDCCGMESPGNSAFRLNDLL